MTQAGALHGVHQIGGMGVSNAYLVETGEQSLTLIDTGTSGKHAKVLAHLKGMGRKPRDVTYIILTHPDMDHSGSAAELRRLTRAQLAIGELDAPRLSGEKSLKEAKGAVD